jgi:hypothetical protein
MNIFPLDISRLPELVALCFLRWKRHRRYSCLAAIIAGVTASTCAQAATVRAGSAVTVVRDVSGSASGTSWEKKVEGDDVYENEFVRTAVRSSAVLSFVDETKISIGQAATMKIDRVVLKPNQSVEELIVSAEAGAVRWNSGTSPSRAYQIKTPEAIIRPVGTIFDLLVETQRTMVVLRRGTIEVCSVGAPQRCGILSRPGEMIIATPSDLEGPQRGELGPSEFADRCLSADAIPCLITASVSPAEPAQQQFGKEGKGTGPTITGPTGPTGPVGRTGPTGPTGPVTGPAIGGPIIGPPIIGSPIIGPPIIIPGGGTRRGTGTTGSDTTPGTYKDGTTKDGTTGTTKDGTTPGTTKDGTTPGTYGTTKDGTTPGTTKDGTTAGTTKDGTTPGKGTSPGTTKDGTTPGKGTTTTGTKGPGTKGPITATKGPTRGPTVTGPTGDGRGGKTDKMVTGSIHNGRELDKGTITGSKVPGNKVLIDKGSITGPLGTGGHGGGPSGIRGPFGIGGHGGTPPGIRGLFGIGGHGGTPSGIRGLFGIGGH